MRTDKPEYRTQLHSLCKEYSAKEISLLLGVPQASLSRDLKRLGLTTKKHPHSLAPWETHIREMYADESITVASLARTFECSDTTMHKFIIAKGMKRKPHPAVEHINITSVNKLVSGEANIDNVQRIMRRDGNHKILISEREYCALWDRVHSADQEQENI